MNYEQYKKYILERFSKNFTIIDHYQLNDITFDFMAMYIEKNIRYFASKKIELDMTENKEFCFFTYMPTLFSKDFSHLANTLESSAKALVNPTCNHMSTYITCIIITENLKDEESLPQIKHYKYCKSFLINIKGWVKIRFIVLDLVFNKIYCCKEGDKVKDIYDYTL